MRTHLNTGHDIETALQMHMMTAIESSGGIAGVRVTVSGPQPTAKSTPVKWEGVGYTRNIGYTKEGLQSLWNWLWQIFNPEANFANKLGAFLS